MAFTIEITDDQIVGVSTMISEYFGLTLPVKYLESLVKNNGMLLGEIIDGSYRDTAARGYFIDAICRDFGVKHWPMNGDSDDYVRHWEEAFKKAAKEKQILVNWSHIR